MLVKFDLYNYNLINEYKEENTLECYQKTWYIYKNFTEYIEKWGRLYLYCYY